MPRTGGLTLIELLVVLALAAAALAVLLPGLGPTADAAGRAPTQSPAASAASDPPPPDAPACRCWSEEVMPAH